MWVHLALPLLLTATVSVNKSSPGSSSSQESVHSCKQNLPLSCCLAFISGMTRSWLLICHSLQPHRRALSPPWCALNRRGTWALIIWPQVYHIDIVFHFESLHSLEYKIKKERDFWDDSLLERVKKSSKKDVTGHTLNTGENWWIIIRWWFRFWELAELCDGSSIHHKCGRATNPVPQSLLGQVQNKTHVWLAFDPI